MDCAILFSDVSGSTALYEIMGDERAFTLIEGCLTSMSNCTTQSGGRVVKTIGDAVMAVFPSAELAATAATEMQLEAEKLGRGAGTPVGLRIGFHFGPVVEQDSDVFGDAVNLASRLCDLAARGEIITSKETASLLPRLFAPNLRILYPVAVKGLEREIELIEIVWQGMGSERTAIASLPPTRAASHTLELTRGGSRVELGRERRKVTFGRDHEADFPITDRMASRAHAMIERRRDRFVLADHSANGTFVTLGDEPEIVLRREEMALRGHGWIAFGQPRALSREAVEFRCVQAWPASGASA
ncbi:MAG TPA: adenylate/guanylate cyclase domain-containing protein [Burkholderiales bacterium]